MKEWLRILLGYLLLILNISIIVGCAFSVKYLSILSPFMVIMICLFGAAWFAINTCFQGALFLDDEEL